MIKLTVAEWQLVEKQCHNCEYWTDEDGCYPDLPPTENCQDILAKLNLQGGTMTIDYEKAWERLRYEVGCLTQKRLQISPEIIHAYMDFIEDILQWESQETKRKAISE